MSWAEDLERQGQDGKSLVLTPNQYAFLVRSWRLFTAPEGDDPRDATLAEKVDIRVQRVAVEYETRYKITILKDKS